MCRTMCHPRQFLRRVWVEEFSVEKVNALMSSVFTRLKQCRADGEENQLSWVRKFEFVGRRQEIYPPDIFERLST